MFSGAGDGFFKALLETGLADIFLVATAAILLAVRVAGMSKGDEERVVLEESWL